MQQPLARFPNLFSAITVILLINMPIFNIEIVVYKRYFDNSAAELFCQKIFFKKDNNLKVLNTQQSQ